MCTRVQRPKAAKTQSIKREIMRGIGNMSNFAGVSSRGLFVSSKASPFSPSSSSRYGGLSSNCIENVGFVGFAPLDCSMHQRMEM